ncbi:MAG TPA: hypothetical protein VMC84_10810 [Methanocella sp.]|uniref:hypothetical protein n=1 Tax=Methanocella sp. TaxID=2052833 RepID=UPI002C47CB78|nr:hypothetical protein [Methanocella sp.]HTY91656.1 hypothetical protein [Methanocella sp.]
MSKKSSGDSLTSKMELINKKIREINDRRKGQRVTHIEDELDRQELNSYMRLMGVEQGSISLESAEEDAHALPRDNIFYATVTVEALIELALLIIAASYLATPSATTVDYIMAAVLLGMFGYIAYVMYRYVKSR